MKFIEKQVIVNWYKPSEKLPEEGTFVVVSYSGPLTKNVTCDHALMLAVWFNDGLGWSLEYGRKSINIKNGIIHAWADLEPYMGD